MTRAFKWVACLVTLAGCGSSDAGGLDLSSDAFGAAAGASSAANDGPGGTTSLAGSEGQIASAGEQGTAGASPAADVASLAGQAGTGLAGIMPSGPTAGSTQAPSAGQDVDGVGAVDAGVSNDVDMTSMTGGAMGGTGGALPEGSMETSAGAGDGNTAGTVTVEFTTVSYGGQYAPRNYGAVWFENADGTFIKTAKRWAGAAHASDLVEWTEASGGWGSAFFGGSNTADQMDAISQATIRDHESHSVTWDMHDTMGELVPDGDYVVALEMSESRAQQKGPVLRVPFTKGPQPQDIQPADEASFVDIAVHYAP